MEFRKSVQVTKKDNFLFNLHVIKKQHILTCIFVFAVVFALVTLLLRFLMQHPIGYALLYGALTGLLGLILWNVYILLFKVTFRLNKLYKKGTLYTFRQDLVFDKDSITATTQTGTNVSKYKYILRAEETPFAFYLFMKDDFAYTIPKKQLTQADDAQLRKVLRAYLNADQVKKLKKA